MRRNSAIPSSPVVAAGREVHVLHDDVDAALIEAGQRGRGIGRDLAADVVHVEQHPQRLRHGGLIFDDQNVHQVRCDQTLLVAIAGDTPLARIAGKMVATMPLIQSSTTPISTRRGSIFTSDTRLTSKKFKP